MAGPYKFSQFRDTFQDGSHIALYEAKTTIEGTNLNAKWDFEGAGRSTRIVWDKILGTQVLQLGNTVSKARMSLSHPAGLGLRQPCLCVQVLYYDGDLFKIDLRVIDTNGTKHVLYLSSTFRETSKDRVLHSKIPIHFKAPGAWTSMCVDLQTIVHTLFNAVDFQTLDSIVLHGSCSIKRVFTLKLCPMNDFEGVDGMSAAAAIARIPFQLQFQCRDGSRALTQVINLQDRDDAADPDKSPECSRQSDRPVIAFGSRITNISRSLPESRNRRLQASDGLDDCTAEMGLPYGDASETTPHSRAEGGAMLSSRHTNSDVVHLNGTPPARPAVLKTDSDIWAAVLRTASKRSKTLSRRSQGLRFPLTLANRDQPLSEESEEDDALSISGVSFSQERKKSSSRTPAQTDRDKPPVPAYKMKPRSGGLELGKQQEPSTSIAFGQNSSLEKQPCYDAGDMTKLSSDEDKTEQHSNVQQFAFEFRGGPSVINSRTELVQQSSPTPTLASARSGMRGAGRSTVRKWAFDDNPHMPMPIPPPHQPSELSIGGLDVAEQRREMDTSTMSNNAQSTSIDITIAEITNATLQKPNMPETNTTDPLDMGGLIGVDGSYCLPSFGGRGSSRLNLESRLSERSSVSSMSWMAQSKAGTPYERLSDRDLESFSQLKQETEEGRDESVIVHAVNTERGDLSRASSRDLPSPHSTMGSSLDYPWDMSIGKDLGETFGAADRLHFGSQLEEPHILGLSCGLWDEDASASLYSPGDSTPTSPVLGTDASEEIIGMPLEEICSPNDLDYEPHIPSPSLSVGPPDPTYAINTLLPALTIWENRDTAQARPPGQ